MTSQWDFNVQKAAQSSFRSAHDLFTYISGQKQGTSIQELSLITEKAIAEFRKLLFLLDGPPLHRKRIRKGPLPKSLNINPIELLENSNSSVSPRVDPIRFDPPHPQFMQLFHHHNTPNNNFQLYQQRQHPTSKHFDSVTDVLAQKNSFLQFDGCISQSSSTVLSRQSFPSSISLDRSCIGKPMMQNSSLSMQSTRDDGSMFSSKMTFGGKSESESRKCAASTGGCHCSKRRQAVLNLSLCCFHLLFQFQSSNSVNSLNFVAFGCTPISASLNIVTKWIVFCVEKILEAMLGGVVFFAIYCLTNCDKLFWGGELQKMFHTCTRFLISIPPTQQNQWSPIYWCVLEEIVIWIMSTPVIEERKLRKYSI